MIERVGHIGQPHPRARPRHPLRQHPRRRRHPLRPSCPTPPTCSPPDRVPAQRGTGSGACSITTCAFVPLTPNDDTPARRGTTRRRPLHALRRDGEAGMRLAGMRGQLLEVQMPGNVAVAHAEHGLDETRRYPPPIPDDPDWSSPTPAPTARSSPDRRKPGSAHRVRSDHPAQCRCRGPRRSRCRPAVSRDDANAWRSNACWAGPLGTVTPLLAPSWLTAEPRTTASTRSPSRTRIGQPLEHHHPAALAAHIPVGARIEGLALPVRRQHPPSRAGDARSPG